LQKHEQWERRWELAELKSAIPSLGKSYLCSTTSVRPRVETQLALPEIEGPESVPADADTLIVAGGGTLIDRAKVFRRNNWPALNLIAMPTIWGSGAEVSPVAVLTGAKKDIHFSDDLLPDHYVVWPELAESAPAELLRFACGDVWSHALEAFCSPLATETIRKQAAELMNEIASYPLGFDARWFDASAAACLLQARSSVGLIHGFAHVLEPLLLAADLGGHWGHAKLCSIFLSPVLTFNLSRSPKVQTLATNFGLDLNKVQAVTKSLFDDDAYARAMSVAEQHWDPIARDRCSRTNCILVRRDSLEYFQQFRGSGAVA
jgi:alcohol dehydrogenase class IV